MQTQLDYYIKNQDELVKKYNSQIIAVVDGEWVGTFNSKGEALEEMLERGYKPRTFMIIKCTPGDHEYTAKFYGNVSFSQVGIYRGK